MIRSRFITFALVVLFCHSCSQKKSDGNVKVFHYNQPQKITSLDPAFAKSQNNMWAVHHLFNTLIQLDENLQLKPCLAKSWEISEDGLEYKFDLRTDVLFHKDDCFTKTTQRFMKASDIVFSFNRIIDSKINSPGSWIFADKIADLDPFLAPNDSTFILNLKEAFLPMINILSMQYCSVMSEKAVMHYGNLVRSNPIGTGPFQFKRWLETQGLYLVKNQEYFEYNGEVRLPYLDGVRASFIEDRKIAFLELLNDKLECVSGLESSFINEMLDNEGNLQDEKEERINLNKSPYLNFEYLGINMVSVEKNSPLRKKEFRQALNFAIDRKTMMQSLRNNIGIPANSGVIPRGLPSYNPEEVMGYSYDLKKARDLLDKSSYSPETSEELIINTNKDYLDITTFVAKQWEKLGIRSRINLLESATLREGMRNGNLDLFRASWIADYPDGESFLCLFYSKNPAPPNYTRFTNKLYDEYYEKAIKENNMQSRTELYHKMNRIIVEDAPVIFLFYDESALFSSERITGISSNGINLLQVKELREK